MPFELRWFMVCQDTFHGGASCLGCLLLWAIGLLSFEADALQRLFCLLGDLIDLPLHIFRQRLWFVIPEDLYRLLGHCLSVALRTLHPPHLSVVTVGKVRLPVLLF